MMTDLQILTQAIQKAQKNGYRYILEYDDENDKHYVRMLDLHQYYAIIFDHSFAKAFWGEKKEWHPRCGASYARIVQAWEGHLQAMSLCEKPLEYIKYYLGE